MKETRVKVSLIVPCYNEQAALPFFYTKVKTIIDSLPHYTWELLFVNDGSKDKTWELIESEHQKYPYQVYGVKLAKNVGHQYALTAGLITAADLCDICVSIDADLQDDVSVIEYMVDKYHDGCDIVYGVRKERKTDTFFKRFTAQSFYKLMAHMGVNTVYNHADFRLMSCRALRQFSNYREYNLFLRGIVPLIGYKTDCVYYDRKERAAGVSKYPLKKMLALAFDGISSFSTRPIDLILTAGFVIVFLSFLAFIYALVSYFTGNVEPGWTSIIISIWFLGGMQLLAIGLVGKYVGKTYIEVKHRPRYNIEKVLTDESPEN